MNTVNKLPSSKLPSDYKLIVSLIMEELKSRKFFNGLLQLGLDNCPYQPQLDDVIMNLVGLTDESNQTYDFYYFLIERHSAEIDQDRESSMREAKKVYKALAKEVARRKV